MVHASAVGGYQSASEKYQRGRPGYSTKALTWLRDDLGIGSSSRVVDVGAGTGKFTARLCEISKYVVAVDPVANMRARMKESLPQVTALDGDATNIPLDDGSADVVICAQAFHWFATDAALEEFRRVLKPGGKLGLIWNVRDETKDWVAELTKIITPYEGDAPRYYKGDWRKPFPAKGFSPLQSIRFPHSHIGHPDDVIVNRFMSVSFIAEQDEEARSEIEQEIQTLITSHPALSGKSEIAFPYITECFWCEKRD